MQTYESFLESKLKVVSDSGFEVGEIPWPLFEFQKSVVRWAARKGRAAIFADTGQGKTRMQLAWARLVADHTGGEGLILAPLAVGPQTIQEAKRCGISLKRITITNYESLHKINPSDFAGVVLDESSILKSYTGTTKRALCEAFAKTHYRLACTATPAPNDYLELGNHSQFLGVMESPEMISRWFINDTMQAGAYRLKEHGRSDFWRWVASWAVCFANPSDIGFAEEGKKFILPPLRIYESILPTDDLPAPDGRLFRDAELSSTTMHGEMRLTAGRRAERVAELVAEIDGPVLIWTNTDYEADAVRKLLPDLREVKGSDSIESKVDGLIGFSEGKYRVLLTKPKIGGFGMNWQHCQTVIFMGMSFSYETFYQSIRRCWRFGQTEPVTVHVVIADSEGGILRTVQAKQKEHERMKEEMQTAMDEVMNLGSGNRELVTLGDWKESRGDGWRLILDDCVRALSREPENSIGFSIFSPPFSNLYIYSDSIADMGNTADLEEFMTQYEFLVQQLRRVMIPGRLVAVHCKDLPAYKNRDGAMGLVDFPGRLVQAMESDGAFQYHSRVTIWKDPVIEMQRTKNHGLLYKELCKDSCGSRQGMADYILVFRKWEGIEDKEPVNSGHPERFFDYIGSSKVAEKEYARGRSPEEIKRLYSIAVWQRYASPVWFDIQQTNVLNKDFARDESDERHICPLQLDVIERCIELWSNPGDVVLSPFAGIGSEGYVAVKIDRRFLGIELKDSYFKIAAGNLRAAGKAKGQGGLFDSEYAEVLETE